jgi:hypothetical protein
MYRPKTRGVYDVADFILDWWNEEWVDDPYKWYDQSTLRRIMGGVAKGNLRESLSPSLSLSLFDLRSTTDRCTHPLFGLRSTTDRIEGPDRKTTYLNQTVSTSSLQSHPDSD